MKKLSNALTKYLHEQGALEAGNEEMIPHHVREYRKLYKRNWKLNKGRQNKTIKLYFNPAEYSSLSERAKLYGYRTTPFAKDCVLTTLLKGELIPNKEELQLILQKVGMSIMQTPNDSEAYTLLLEAERILINYLNI